MFDKAHPIQQAGAVPFRRRKGKVEFCLITTSKKKRWGFPKGVIDPGETSEETALKEAFEEAGLNGRLDEEPLGQYQYRKWGTTLTVTCYLMHVDSADDEWPEDDSRTRNWCTAEEAREIIKRDALLELLDAAVARTGTDGN